MQLTLTGYIEKVKSGALDPREVAEYYMQQAKDDTYNAWVHLHEQYVEDNIVSFGERELCAAPIAIKDLIMTKGYETSCASKMLQGYIPPYSATCFANVEAAGGLMLGKTNMDEFAMGASTEYSAFGISRNPHDPTRVPGGSSGGSAIAVAADQCIAALGTDTGGSVRLPAALCGVVGIKPTYGRISRYGVQAMASSLDQVGVLTKTVDDAELLLRTLSGHDPADATSKVDHQDIAERKAQLVRTDLQGVRLALPQQFFSTGLNPEVKASCEEAIGYLRSLGAEVEIVDVPVLSYTVPVYYILVPAQVSTNMARFDGIRFGFQGETDDYDNIYAYYADMRRAGLGDEVKRRIIVGSYVLSAGFYDEYYHKAELVRNKMKKDIAKLYQDYDAIIGPTSTDVASKIGAKVDDPVQMYLEDLYTSAANLLGLPAISVPVRPVEREGVNLPVGFQIMGNKRQEGKILGIAKCLEQQYV